MRCGLFGKLPAKRDFIAISAPREFLGAWERWVQAGLSTSRARLGRNWQEAFLRAPIWRFWLGAEVCGSPVLGAFMPSVDGVGRYFPLTVFACAEAEKPIAPPELETHDDWFSTAEDLLLSSLEGEMTFEAVLSGLDRLALPSGSPAEEGEIGISRLEDGTVVTEPSASDLRQRLSAIRVGDHQRAYAAQTFWWTLGGADYPPRAVVGQRLPDPYIFVGMLTGSFESAFR